MSRDERWDLYHGPYSLPRFLDDVLDKGLTTSQFADALIDDWLPHFYDVNNIDTGSKTYRVGFEAGYEEGYSDGVVEADADSAYEDGSAEGYSEGHKDGYSEGYSDARDEFEI